MPVDLLRHMLHVLEELRFRSTLKHIRVLLDGQPVADTFRAVLIWEPYRIVPSYAVPIEDMIASMSPVRRHRLDADSTAEDEPVPIDDGARRVLDPSIGFAAHTASGTPMSVEVGGREREGAAFRLDEPGVDHLVVLDFSAFDWLEEDEPIVGHPRDPFSRIDIRSSSRQVRVELDSHLLAESSRPSLLFEGSFPFARFYLPREDVRAELLPSDTRTTCAYKGHATHYSVHTESSDGRDVAWSYLDPLPDASQITGLVAFYQERTDLIVDGKRLPRPRTPWSRRQLSP
jgi:uncharacterized protein (DUF427 family)